MTTIAAAPATGRHWCVYCPDLIVEGEMTITDPTLKDPFNEPGCAHFDCATAHGWTVELPDHRPAPEVAARAAFRQRIRDHDPIEVDL